MYDGSMVGAGAVVFAVMGYVIARQKPDREVGSQIRLNPMLLAAILGEPQEDVERAVEYLCSPDPKTTTPGHEGRRLVKLGQFEYQVVNGAKYRAIRNEEERRTQCREAKRREREKDSKPVKKNRPLRSSGGGPGKGEREYVEAERNGASQAELDDITTKHLPKGKP